MSDFLQVITEAMAIWDNLFSIRNITLKCIKTDKFAEIELKLIQIQWGGGGGGGGGGVEPLVTPTIRQEFDVLIIIDKAQQH